jgi:hypothetical protein
MTNFQPEALTHESLFWVASCEEKHNSRYQGEDPNHGHRRSAMRKNQRCQPLICWKLPSARVIPRELLEVAGILYQIRALIVRVIRCGESCFLTQLLQRVVLGLIIFSAFLERKSSRFWWLGSRQ